MAAGAQLGMHVELAPTADGVRGAIPGLGPTGYRLDGDQSLLEYATMTRPDAVAEYGRTIDELRDVRRTVSEQDPPEAIPAGGSISNRFALDLGTSAPLPTDGVLHIRATVALVEAQGSPPSWMGSISTTAAVTVADDPVRLPAWGQAIDAAGRDDEVLRWIAAHQGPEPYFGCTIDTGFRRGAWEVEAYDHSGTPVEQQRNLRIRVTPAGVVESIVQPIGALPPGDPDAPGRPEDEVVLRSSYSMLEEAL